MRFKTGIGAQSFAYRQSMEKMLFSPLINGILYFNTIFLGLLSDTFIILFSYICKRNHYSHAGNK